MGIEKRKEGVCTKGDSRGFEGDALSEIQLRILRRRRCLRFRAKEGKKKGVSFGIRGEKIEERVLKGMERSREQSHVDESVRRKRERSGKEKNEKRAESN